VFSHNSLNLFTVDAHALTSSEPISDASGSPGRVLTTEGFDFFDQNRFFTPGHKRQNMLFFTGVLLLMPIVS
jgi:hypothetical protein